MVEIDLYLALHEEVTTLLHDPLAEVVAHADAEMDEVGWIVGKVPLQRGCELGLASLTAMLRLRSL